MKELLKEIVDTLELHAVAIIELQAKSQNKDPILTRESSAQHLTELFGKMREKVDAMPVI